MSGSGTHEPTAKALKRAKESGDVPFSGLLSGALVLLFAWWLSGSVIAHGRSTFDSQWSWVLSRIALPQPRTPTLGELQGLVENTVGPLAGFAVVLVVFVTGVGALQTRGWFSVKTIAPRLDRIAPSNRALRLENLRALFVGGLGAVVAMGIALQVWITNSRGIAGLTLHEPDAAFWAMVELGRAVVLHSALFLVVLGSADLALAQLLHRRRHRMSEREVRLEQRDAEGDPQVRQQRRSLQKAAERPQALPPAVVLKGREGIIAIGYSWETGERPVILERSSGAKMRRELDAMGTTETPVRWEPNLVRKLWPESGRRIPRSLYSELARALNTARLDTADSQTTQATAPKVDDTDG